MNIISAAKMLDIPVEAITKIPVFILEGKNELTIESYISVIEYIPEKIRINTSKGIVEICGSGLVIGLINKEKVEICGNIKKVEYIG